MGSTQQNHVLFTTLCTIFFFLPMVCSVTSVHKMLRLYEMEGELLSVARIHFQNIGPRFRLESFQSFLWKTENERSLKSFIQPSALLPVIQYRLNLRFSRWFCWRRRLSHFFHPKIRKFLDEYRRLSMKYQFVDFLNRQSSQYPVYALNMLELRYGSDANLFPEDKSVAGASFHLSPCEALELASLSSKHCLEEATSLVTPVWIERAIRHLRLRYPYWSDTRRLSEISNTCRLEGHIISINAHLTLRNLVANLDVLLDSYREFVDYEVKPDPEVQACNVTERINSTLYCFYFNGLLGPYARFKYELRHEFISVIHDLIPSSVASQIIEAAGHTMRVSKVSENDEDFSMLIVRLCEDGHLEEFPHLKEWLNKRIHVATLLRTDDGSTDTFSSEIPSVINYGIGGFYQSHFDYFESDEIQKSISQPSGNRLATVMVFLSSAVYGGHTAFTNLNLSVKPSAGKGLFWFNLHPISKRLLNESLHCACAVINGSKWIVTKWIREYNNFGAIMPTGANASKQDHCNLTE